MPGSPGNRWSRPAAALHTFTGFTLGIQLLPLQAGLPDRGLLMSWQLGMSLGALRMVALGSSGAQITPLPCAARGFGSSSFTDFPQSATKSQRLMMMN